MRLLLIFAGIFAGKGYAQDSLALKPPLPDMVWVKGGAFEMGTTDYLTMQQELEDAPPFNASVSDFYMGKYEVSFDEYDQFCSATKRSQPDDEGWGRGKLPVINVSWYDAVDYCIWLSIEHGLVPCYKKEGTVIWEEPADGYRLPTEVEWEYAARDRGEKNRKYPWGLSAPPTQTCVNADAAWENYNDTYPYTAPIGAMQPTGKLGICDLAGNVWEWCWDNYSDYPSDKRLHADYKQSDEGIYRVLRGCAWDGVEAYKFRSAYRIASTPNNRTSTMGFRLVRSAKG